MEIKRCKACGAFKMGDEFRDYNNICKECNRSRMRKWRSENRSRIAAYMVSYREKNPDKVVLYRCYDTARNTEYQRRYREKFPERAKARSAAQHALSKGRIIRKGCEVCGKPNGVMHHSDYSKPLMVTWLCRKHHQILHGRKIA